MAEIVTVLAFMLYLCTYTDSFRATRTPAQRPPAGRPRARENATLAEHTHVVCVWHVHVTWRCSQVNSTLAEISLKGNRLDDRAATPLCEVCSVGTTSRRRGRSSALRAPSLA